MRVRSLDKRVPPERIVIYMPVQDQEEPAVEADGRDDRAPATATEPAEQVEFDERRAKLERLRAAGIDPYPPVSLFSQRTRIADVLAAHDAQELAAGEHPDLRYHIAGRLISRRGHGKTAFLDVRDLSGSIQAVVRVDALGQETYDRILGLDIGDIVGVEGCVYVTQRGQLALAVLECTLLTKTLRPPPDRHHGLGDTGTRYRYRELDLLANEDTRELFITRHKIVFEIRKWLNERNFVEVETPALQSLARGRSPPTTTRWTATCTCASRSSCSSTAASSAAWRTCTTWARCSATRVSRPSTARSSRSSSS
jgi:lysyl-tRNA synthetase, class II